MIKLEQIKKNLGSKVAQNGMWLYLNQTFNMVIPFITLPYITRILGANEYGTFSIAFNLTGYFMVVVEYGFGMSGVRKASLAKNIDELHVTFTAIVISRMILCALCAIGATIYGYVILRSSLLRMSLFIQFLMPLGTVLQQNWLFQGLQKMKYITITTIMARTISIICIFCFIKTSDDLVLYCIFYSSTTFLSGIIGLCFALKQISVRFVRITIDDILNELKLGWYVFTTSLSSKIFNTFGITILGILSTDYYVGVYSAIQKIPQMILLMWSPISQVLYPIASQKMTESYVKGREYVLKIEKYILTCCTFFLFIIALFTKKIVFIAFGPEYSDYHYLIYPLLAWLFFGIINNFSGIQTLLAGGYYKEYSRCFLISVVITIVSNFAFFYMFDINGVPFAAAISEIILGILLHLEVRKIRKRV